MPSAVRPLWQAGGADDKAFDLRSVQVGQVLRRRLPEGSVAAAQGRLPGKPSSSLRGHFRPKCGPPCISSRQLMPSPPVSPPPVSSPAAATRADGDRNRPRGVRRAQVVGVGAPRPHACRANASRLYPLTVTHRGGRLRTCGAGGRERVGGKCNSKAVRLHCECRQDLVPHVKRVGVVSFNVGVSVTKATNRGYVTVDVGRGSSRKVGNPEPKACICCRRWIDARRPGSSVADAHLRAFC